MFSSPSLQCNRLWNTLSQRVGNIPILSILSLLRCIGILFQLQKLLSTNLLWWFLKYVLFHVYILNVLMEKYILTKSWNFAVIKKEKFLTNYLAHWVLSLNPSIVSKLLGGALHFPEQQPAGHWNYKTRRYSSLTFLRVA